MFVTKSYYDELLDKIADAKGLLEFTRSEQQNAWHNTGDGWHDNPYYIQTLALERKLVKEIDDLTAQLASAKIVERAQTDECVSLFTIVTLHEYNHTTGAMRTREISIVPLGAPPGKDTVPYNAPYAMKLIGAEVGEIIDIKIPLGELEVTVIDIKRMGK
jgi:transcription elongation factor GreA